MNNKLDTSSIYYNESNAVLFEDDKNIEQKFKVSRKDLLLAYIDARKRKRNTRSHLVFEEDLFRNIYHLWKELVTDSYQISESNCFVVTRPKPREVFAASFRDRIVHHLIIGKLMPYFEQKLIDNSFSCMSGKGTLYGVKKLQEAMRRHPNGKVYKNDISSFFMSISKSKLNTLLKEFIELYHKGPIEERKYILALTEQIILHHPEENCNIHGDVLLWNLIDRNKSLFTVGKDRGLPIGNLTSQLFAGVYLMKLDKFLYEQFGDDYGRYVDDFYIVSDDGEKVRKIIPQIEKLLYDDLDLILHPNKRYSQPVRHGCKFLGYVVKGERIYVGNNTVNNFFQTIERYNTTNTITVQDLVNCFRSLNSYLGYLSYCNAYKILRRLLFQLDRRWYPYFKTYTGKLSNKEIESCKKLKITVQYRSHYLLLNYLK